MPKWCNTCQLKPAVKRGECETCARHRYRHGEARPPKLIDAQIDRHYRTVFG